MITFKVYKYEERVPSYGGKFEGRRKIKIFVEYIIWVIKMLKSRIGKVINSKGLKHKWVAEQMGMNPNILSRWVNNNGKPSVERLFKLAHILNCKVDDLYVWEDDE